MSVDTDGSFTIDAVAKISKPGKYNWSYDSDLLGNIGIAIKISGYNVKGPSAPYYGDRTIKPYEDGNPVTVKIMRDYYFYMWGK